MAITCAFSPADTFSYFKMCLAYIALSDWLNVEVQSEDQSCDSFDEAIERLLTDRQLIGGCAAINQESVAEYLQTTILGRSNILCC